MLRMRGRAGGGGAALGTATVLRPPIGIPMVPVRILADMQRRQRDAAFEPIDIVLAAERFSQTVGVTVPWGNVVAILCEEDEKVEASLTPTVTGLPGLLQALADDKLVLVDGDRGTVLVDPDSVSVAAFQAEKERLSPRRRLYLDFAHQPAHTSDGRVIQVVGQARNLEEVSAAVEHGADSVLISTDTEFFASAVTLEEKTYALLEVGRAAAGKAVVLSGDTDSVLFGALLRASLRSEFTLALPAAGGAEWFNAARGQLEEARSELAADELDFGDIRLAAEVRPGDELADSLADYLVNRLIISRLPAEPDHRALDWVSDMVVEASAILVPAIVEVANATAGDIATFIGLGAAGLIVAPESVESAKDVVRGLDYEECRSAVTGRK